MVGIVIIPFILGFALCAEEAGPTDKNCTTDGKYNSAAVICDDNYPASACTVLYGEAVKLNDGTERKDSCFGSKDAINEDLKQMAIANCPKTCGYCCETPAYKCRNKDIPRVKCEQVSQKMCKDATWRQILAEDCPSSCGLCLEGGCVDKAVECAIDPTICKNVDMQVFVKENCQKTCGYCSSVNTSKCDGTTDASPNCANWVKNGFCSSSFYTLEHKKNFCAKSCKVC